MPVSGIGMSSTPPEERATVPPKDPYPSERLDRASTAKCGIRIARFASGTKARKPSESHAAVAVLSSPRRTSRIARAATYATVRLVAIPRPCDRCAVATCPHASAASASHTKRRHPEAEKNPDAPTSANGVHASVPANGRLIATIEAEIAIARERPPAVAATLPSPSLRRNQNRPRPAMIGVRTMRARSPPPHPNATEDPIVDRDRQPLCGSAANQVPAIS